ncbi:MAG TPA: DUF4436 family protein [Candidatus Angelobacter sp.]|nr:DUF4436 family protein [Candidatus Angelobacter sp.]
MASPAIAHRESPPETALWRRSYAILTAAVLLAFYVATLWFAFTEAERRTVSLEIPPHTGDYLLMEVAVAHVDLMRSELTARISFRPVGKLSGDDFTPATDMQLILNTVRGQQQFDLRKGSRINPIEAVFPLEGQVNRYPFDTHKGDLWFFLTMPQKAKLGAKTAMQPPKISQGHLDSFKNKDGQKPIEVLPELAKSPSLPVSASALEKKVQVDTKTKFVASISGLTFLGTRPVQSAQTMKGLTGIELNLRRSANVVLISVSTMVMMGTLAVVLVIMVLRIIAGDRQMGTFHIPMAVSLIFGLPALRNLQPGIPPPGTFGDSVAYTWAEVSAAGSAVALAIHWLFHRTSSKTAPAPRN